jgi:hypothetical protein
MYNTNIPNERELPSTKKLVKSTVLAAIGAGVLLITVVMPAEYAIDPTGFGKLTGLQQMGEIRVSLAEEAAQEEATKIASTGTPATEVKPEPVSQEVATPTPQTDIVATATRKDTTNFTLAPNESIEIKATMNKGQKVNFEWISSGKINFDYHADSKKLKIKYHGYAKGVGQDSDKGVIEAAFDGNHGWFWRNRSKKTVTVTLTTNGEYKELMGVD